MKSKMLKNSCSRTAVETGRKWQQCPAGMGAVRKNRQEQGSEEV